MIKTEKLKIYDTLNTFIFNFFQLLLKIFNHLKEKMFGKKKFCNFIKKLAQAFGKPNKYIKIKSKYNIWFLYLSIFIVYF